jgi:two-component system, OmpR family, phosphate regulon sensor histidine kinase PhoR
VDKVLSYLTFSRKQFHELSLRGRVVLSQLPLSLTVLVIVVIAALFQRKALDSPLVLASLALHALMLALCFLVPWDRLPYPSFLAVPLLDFVPIALMREGAGTYVTALGLLAVFPMIWLAASGLWPRTALAAGTLATLLMVWVPLFVNGARITPQLLTRPLLLPFMMLAIAVTVRVMTASMMEQQRRLEDKDAELRSLLEASAQRERLLAAVVNTVDVGVLAVDPDGHQILKNRKQQSLRQLALPQGAPEADEAELEVYRNDGATPLAPQERPAYRAAGGESFSDYLVWMGRPPHQKVLSTSARAMRDDEGRFEGSVVAFNDVTELVAALSAKNEFVSSVSHELRTPLTSILGYAELVRDEEGLPEHVSDSIGIISRNSQRLLGLVNDLLSAAGGHSDVAPQRTDLDRLIAESADSAEPRAAAGGVRLVREVPEGLTAWCDPVRIGQVLDNLLSNAIKYSPDGGTVTIRARMDGGSVVCEVQDTGMGISEADRAELFTKFFRTPAARTAAIPGIGLGLAITKGIVEKHGGTITCESTLGKGSTFTFTLPAASPGSN